ncbi:MULTISPECIES: contact-dependent growth inhibition system immunity protein [Janibacter]|nr:MULTISPECIES: contact-dependent growth inhibition system immunity protein [Janibacter]QNF93310.1 hypothetical protein H7A72_11025 [Janibacter sp. YB324]
MSLELSFPALHNLMSAGFNQDFWELDGSPQAVVSAFTPEPIFCARIPGEVDRLVAQFEGEALDDALQEMGNCYDYAKDGLTGGDWLAAVVAQVRAEAPTTDEISALVGRDVTQVLWSAPISIRTASSEVVFEGEVSVDNGVDYYDVPADGEPSIDGLVGHEILAAFVEDDQAWLATAQVRVIGAMAAVSSPSA